MKKICPHLKSNRFTSENLCLTLLAGSNNRSNNPAPFLAHLPIKIFLMKKSEPKGVSSKFFFLSKNKFQKKRNIFSISRFVLIAS